MKITISQEGYNPITISTEGLLNLTKHVFLCLPDGEDPLKKRFRL